MKLLLKKMILGLCICAVMCGMFEPVSFQAGTLKYTSVNSASKFSKNWEETICYYTNGVAIGKMVYGYDTNWTKEDYTWTIAYQCYSTAKVKRQYVDTSAHNGSQAGKNAYSTIEVEHQSYYVTYGINFSADYSNVTADPAVPSTIK